MSFDSRSITIIRPPQFQFDNTGLPEYENIPSPMGDEIVDVRWGPDLNFIYLIAQGLNCNSLWCVDRAMQGDHYGTDTYAMLMTQKN